MVTVAGRVETNKGDKFYNDLFDQAKKRLSSLRAQEPLKDIDMMDVIESEGVNRRDFMKWVSATTATLMLPPMFAPLVAEATELMNRVPVIWIELQDCAGNSEALLRSSTPTVDDLLFDVLSLEFHETIMAASGHQADAQLEDAIHHFKGKYLLFVEGAIPMAMNGQYGTIGASGETFHEHLMRLSKDAAAIVAVGSCATFGGVPAAAPNPPKGMLPRPAIIAILPSGLLAIFLTPRKAFFTKLPNPYICLGCCMFEIAII